MLVPRRYGGFEFDVPTFVRVIAHLARGCPSTAWQVCLPTAHALLVASWFDERAQDELFADPDFLCPSVAAPVGRARQTGDGFLELTGTHHYCSGAPYGTHYLGQTLPAGPDLDGPPAGPPMLFVAPRSEWTMLDDWGHTLGLKGSGSNSIVLDGGRIPEYFALPDTQMLQVDNSGGTPGQRLHGNPMYVGRALSFFGLEFIALAVGMVKGALDEYLELITTRTTHRPPIVLRAHDPDYQRWYGHARGKVETAEAAMLQAAEQWMEACRRQVDEGVHFDVEEDLRIQSITRESVRLCWDALQEYMFRTAGSGAAHDGAAHAAHLARHVDGLGPPRRRHQRLGRPRDGDRAPRHRARGRRPSQGLRPAVGWSYKWPRSRATASRASTASRCRSTGWRLRCASRSSTSCARRSWRCASSPSSASSSAS